MSAVFPLNHDAHVKKVSESFSAVKALLLSGYPVNCAFSSGKDSSAALNLLLQAARKLRECGTALPPIVVSHGDTQVENPAMATLARQEMGKIQVFASAHDLPVTVAVATPSLAESWVFRTIGQGKLPALPGDSRDCTVSFKINPQTRLRKRIRKQFQNAGYRQDITLIGTRLSESEGRRARMEARGETWDRPWIGENGDLFMSPIADWDEDDVWEYLGACRSGSLPTYSNFDELWETYLAASSSSCAVVADMAMGSSGKSAPCSSRTGCWTCLAAGETDKSLSTMIENRPDDYGYLAPLNRLRDYLFRTRMDWDCRNWVGRTINAAGYLKIQPDVYSPDFLANLLRYCLTIDIEEAEASERAGLNEPRFQILTPKMLVAVDAEWSRQGFQRPFHALSIWRDIEIRGNRYPVPDVVTKPASPMPAPRFVYVGRDWEEDKGWAYTGLRNPLAEAFEECPMSDTDTLSNGARVMDVPTDSAFDIDEEAAEFVLMDVDYLVNRYHTSEYRTTAGYLHYIMLGTLTLSKAQRAKTDEMLRRTAYRERHGLTGPDPDLEDLLFRSIPEADMRADMKELNRMCTIHDARHQRRKDIAQIAPAKPVQSCLF